VEPDHDVAASEVTKELTSHLALYRAPSVEVDHACGEEGVLGTSVEDGEKTPIAVGENESGNKRLEMRPLWRWLEQPDAADNDQPCTDEEALTSCNVGRCVEK
jgi:hypothetical protein